MDVTTVACKARCDHSATQPTLTTSVGSGLMPSCAVRNKAFFTVNVGGPTDATMTTPPPRCGPRLTVVENDGERAEGGVIYPTVCVRKLECVWFTNIELRSRRKRWGFSCCGESIPGGGHYRLFTAPSAFTINHDCLHIITTPSAHLHSYPNRAVKKKQYAGFTIQKLRSIPGVCEE